ncbi:MAG: signal peptidase I, partial [Planctomycetia bacterium]
MIRNPLGMQRETVESIVIAFTLALLFRAFEAEAFVIPTGSMAPTLMGRHKDLVCSACGDDYRVGCSAEEDEQSQEFRARLAQLEAEAEALRDKARSPDDAGARTAARKLDQLEARGGQLDQLRTRLARKLVQASRCGNCGHVMQLVTDTAAGVAYYPAYPSYNGDRVLVDKFSYDFREPRRFDVVVFKYPEDAKTNYIKRLIGLPGETVSIVGGDIWTSRDGQSPEIARKPTERLLAMLQCVHDTRHEAAALRAAGWPSRWTDWSAPGAAPGWTAEGTGFRSRATGSATLRYRHLVASPDDWDAAEAGTALADRAAATLVDDFQPYNAVATRPHWVGDLAVEARLDSRSESGTVTLDLVEG